MDNQEEGEGNQASPTNSTASFPSRFFTFLRNSIYGVRDELAPMDGQLLEPEANIAGQPGELGAQVVDGIEGSEEDESERIAEVGGQMVFSPGSDESDQTSTFVSNTEHHGTFSPISIDSLEGQYASQWSGPASPNPSEGQESDLKVHHSSPSSISNEGVHGSPPEQLPTYSAGTEESQQETDVHESVVNVASSEEPVTQEDAHHSDASSISSNEGVHGSPPTEYDEEENNHLPLINDASPTERVSQQVYNHSDVSSPLSSEGVHDSEGETYSPADNTAEAWQEILRVATTGFEIFTGPVTQEDHHHSVPSISPSEAVYGSPIEHSPTGSTGAEENDENEVQQLPETNDTNYADRVTHDYNVFGAASPSSSEGAFDSPAQQSPTYSAGTEEYELREPVHVATTNDTNYAERVNHEDNTIFNASSPSSSEGAYGSPIEHSPTHSAGTQEYESEEVHHQPTSNEASPTERVIQQDHRYIEYSMPSSPPEYLHQITRLAEVQQAASLQPNGTSIHQDEVPQEWREFALHQQRLHREQVLAAQTPFRATAQPNIHHDNHYDALGSDTPSSPLRQSTAAINSGVQSTSPSSVPPTRSYQSDGPTATIRPRYAPGMDGSGQRSQQPSRFLDRGEETELPNPTNTRRNSLPSPIEHADPDTNYHVSGYNQGEPDQNDVNSDGEDSEEFDDGSDRDDDELNENDFEDESMPASPPVRRSRRVQALRKTPKQSVLKYKKKQTRKKVTKKGPARKAAATKKKRGGRRRRGGRR